MADRHNSGEWQKPFWQQRGWVISAGFFLVVAALAGVALLTGGGGGDRQPSVQENRSAKPSREASGSEGAETADAARPEGCTTDDSNQELPESPPEDVAWRANGAHHTPTSPSAGPRKFDGPVWSCFARTPLGSVMAVHAITDQMPYSGWERVVEEQMVPGEARDALAAKRSERGNDPKDAAPSAVVYKGFSILSYSPDDASVMMLYEVSGKYITASGRVSWHEGDWKLVPYPDGALIEDISEVSGPEGFILW